jgi:hypothetical protein
MQIIFTRHARLRMQQRHITELQLQETLEDPDELLPGDNGGDRAIRHYGERDVRVVYREVEEDVFVIFTVMKPRRQDWS